MKRDTLEKKPIDSQREDGRGHWPAGKHRSTLSAGHRAGVIRKLRKATEQLGSVRAVARTLKISDRSIRRIFSGEDQPTERIKTLVDGRI